MAILENEQVIEILKSLEKELNSKEFDSHNFIFVFMRKYPKVYTQGLCRYNSSDDPIRIFHAEIGKFLKQCTEIESLGEKDSTLNARGLHSKNEKWRRI